MSDAGDTRTGRKTRTGSTPLGVYDTQDLPGLTRFDLLALTFSVIWLVAAGAFLFASGHDTGELGDRIANLRTLVGFLVIALPLGMIWLAAAALRAAHLVRLESQRLQAAVDAMRQAQVAQAQGRGTGDEQASVARKLDEIAAATRKTETVLATFTSRRDIPQPTAAEPAPAAAFVEEQPALALGTPPEDSAPPLETDDFLRALNFPETAEDKAGFAALRRAMQDRTAAHLIQAAQDALTLLSQDGIYMDDLVPDRARTDIWRQFGQGERGRAVAALGGIHDRDVLATIGARMKQDPIFRDTAHHFLRRFDKVFATFEKVATDAEIQALADTRTARAFMLLGRVAGTFD